jgi:hypothetical protein
MGGQLSRGTYHAVSYDSSTTLGTNANVTMMSGALVILFPLLVVLSIILQRRYRQLTLQQRIARLEKLWLLNPHRHLS